MRLVNLETSTANSAAVGSYDLLNVKGKNNKADSSIEG